MISLTDIFLLLARKAQNVLKWPLSNHLLEWLERRPCEHREPDRQWILTASESSPYPPLKVLAFQNAKLILNSGNVIVNGKVVPDSIRIPNNRHVHKEFWRKGLKIVKFDGAVASIDTIWTHNYYHMLTDGLLAMFALRAVPKEVPLTVVTRIKCPPVMMAAFREWLPNRTIIQLHNTSQILAPLVILPPRQGPVRADGMLLEGLAGVPHPIRHFIQRYGKGCRLPDALHGPLRLFIGRKNTKWRRMLNEPEVESFLESRGFVSIQIQDFTNEQQFELFRKATSIVAIRGASVGNLLAIERPLKFISIRPTSDEDGAKILHSFIRLNNIEYGEIRGDGYDKSSDFSIDLSCLEAELDRLAIH
jgi:hypothetical protein